jgi:menaquinone-dependent protoporphyrinogen IX oxidase
MSEKKETSTETKAQKFARLAVFRTEKALTAVASLGGLTNKGNYEYTEEQWTKIMVALEAELTKLQGKIKNPTASEEKTFTL